MRTSSAAPLRGDERPRIEVYPAYVYSRGRDAVDLWELASGGAMDQWQRDAEDILCGVAEDGTWACEEYLELAARQNGKNCIPEARVLAGFLLWGERLILWSAQLRDTALEGFLRVEELLRGLGRGVGKNLILIDDGAGNTIRIKVNYTNGKEAFIRLDERHRIKQRIKVITRSEQSGRGLSPDTIVIDEAMFLTDGEQEALAFAQSARPNPQMLYTTSPPLNGHTGAVLFRLRDRAEAMVNGERLEDDGDEPEALGARIWGVAGDLEHLDAIDLDDPRNVAAANPAYGTRILPRTVRRERRKMTAKGFARERLCIWPAPLTVAGGRIDQQKWEDIQDSQSERDPDLGVAIGVEIAPDFDYAAIAIYGARDDGLGHAALAERRAGVTWIVPYVVQLARELEPVAIGMNRATFAALQTELRNVGMVRPEDRAGDEEDSDTAPRRGDLMVTSATEAAAACGQLIVAVDEMSMKVKPHPAYPEILNGAVLGAKTRRAGDSIAWVRANKQDEIEISPVGALTSARFAYLSRVDLVVDERPPPPPPQVEQHAGASETGGLMDAGF